MNLDNAVVVGALVVGARVGANVGAGEGLAVGASLQVFGHARLVSAVLNSRESVALLADQHTS